MKYDAGKPQLSLVPTEIITAIARVREFGVEKYKDPENWRTVSVRRYTDAAFRHFLRFIRNPKGVDNESGLPHIWHCACNIAFIIELMSETDSKRYNTGTELCDTCRQYHEHGCSYTGDVDSCASYTPYEEAKTDE